MVEARCKISFFVRWDSSTALSITSFTISLFIPFLSIASSSSTEVVLNRCERFLFINNFSVFKIAFGLIQWFYQYKRRISKIFVL